MGVIDRGIDWSIKTGVKHFARLWKNDGYLGTPLPNPPKNQDPIVLVNGFSVYNEVLAPAMRSMQRDGATVYAPEFPNNAMDHIDDSAKFLGNYVQNVLKETGARKVDLVGFSEGGLIQRAYVKYHGGDKYVDRAVSLATPHNGVLFSGLGQAIQGVGLLRKWVPEGAQEMIKGSDFLTKLNAGDPTPGKDVKWYSIYSKSFDGIVWPANSPVLEGAKNLELTKDSWFPWLKGPHHLGLQRSHEAYELVRDIMLEKI